MRILQRYRWPRRAAATLWALLPLSVPAADVHAEDSENLHGTLETITVTAHSQSTMPAASAGEVSAAELSLLPILRPAAILETVPGVIVTQHSGEGKANQYFLRAFNLDHGTDFSVSVDGMPVNLPSHAHGQGYSDLNFLIPETVDNLHYRKGPYYADTGDFSAAGSVRIDLQDQLPASAAVSLGDWSYRRLLAMTSVAQANGVLSVAAEGYHNNGPFSEPDDYQRHNALLRLRTGAEDRNSSWTLMHYDGRWNATDQVSSHLIDSGVVGRFGSLAPSDGGDSGRDSLSYRHHESTSHRSWDVSAYLINYRLRLYSTFTDHLSDVTLGDQIGQHDHRQVYGGAASLRSDHVLWGHASSTLVGMDWRTDHIDDVGIDRTVLRQRIATVQDASVRQTALGAYVENATVLAPWMSLTVGLRADALDVSVQDRLVGPGGQCSIATDPLGCDSGRRRGGLLAPKLGVTIGPFGALRGYANVASGFHSNDARGITRSGADAVSSAVTPLTRAQSAEAGIVVETARWRTAIDVYQLKLDSELVFSGDAGVTEPAGATTRRGIEVAQTWGISEALHFDLHGAYSVGHFDQPTAADDLGCGDADPRYPCSVVPAISGRDIPNSPRFIVGSSLTYTRGRADATLQLRHFGASPLVEDGSVESAPYTTLDLRLDWRLKHGQLSLEVFNLTNTPWNDISYYYASRHPNERFASVDTVIHPGIPRTVRLSARIRMPRS